MIFFLNQKFVKCSHWCADNISAIPKLFLAHLFNVLRDELDRSDMDIRESKPSNSFTMCSFVFEVLFFFLAHYGWVFSMVQRSLTGFARAPLMRSLGIRGRKTSMAERSAQEKGSSCIKRSGNSSSRRNSSSRSPSSRRRVCQSWGSFTILERKRIRSWSSQLVHWHSAIWVDTLCRVCRVACGS